MNNESNYRKFYQGQCGIQIPDGFDIHHLDFDRSNNNLDNLLLLPTELHSKYHQLVMVCSQKPTDIILSTIEHGNGYNFFYLEQLKEFTLVYTECQKWKDYKMYLLGFLPNLHNIYVSKEEN